MPQDERPPGALNLLTDGEVELKGRMPWSSNATFLVGLCLTHPDGRTEASDAIYKPHRGERPLWDFPGGLYRREVAAYRLSEALGWGMVPETVIRPDGPLGEGSFQRFIEADFSEHYFTLLEHEDLHPQLRRMALFDLLANNADRKSGHCLLTEDDRKIWGIDHGVCFHDEPKLRTVIWDFAGEPIDADLHADVAHLLTDPPMLDDLLSIREVAAFSRRLDLVTRLARFPDPGRERPYPWPLV